MPETKNRVIFISLLLLIFVVVFSFFVSRDIEATISNGDNAVNLVGQYNAAGTVDYSKSGLNNGPNTQGLNSPDDVAIDETNHLMFVIDKSNYRVLVFNLDTDNSTLDYTADYVLGQDDFVSGSAPSSATAANFSAPSGITVDPSGSRVFIADSAYNRVLIFSTTSISNGMNASVVLGQADFTSSDAATTATGFSAPEGIYYNGSDSYLYVADKTNNRVLVFDASSGVIATGDNAINVLGQSDFISSGAATTAVGLSAPVDVAYGDEVETLFISDQTNNRVVIHVITELAPLGDGRTADKVFGQADMTSGGSGSGAAQFNAPNGLDYDAGNDRLYVADYGNSRIQSFDVSTIDTNENAADSLTGSIGYGLELIDSLNYLAVAEVGKHRLALYDIVAIAPDELPQEVYGRVNAAGEDIISADNGANNGANDDGFNLPAGVAVDTTNHRLFISDQNNDRVLVYNLNSSDQLVDYTPDKILGKTDYFDASASSVAQNTITKPGPLVYDSGTDYLYVADDKRVLVFNVASITDGENAINVLAQADFDSMASATSATGVTSVDGLALDPSGDILYVSNASSNRVLLFDISSIGDGESAVNVLGQGDFLLSGADTSASGMSAPTGLAYSASKDWLFVADKSNNRVTVYDVSTVLDGENASAVLGQVTFLTSTSDTTQSTFDTPVGLSLDDTNFKLFVSDSTNNRVLIFDYVNISSGETAENILGQTDFVTASSGVTQSKFSTPTELLFNTASQRLFVVDSANNRSVVFDASSSANTFPTTPTLSTPANAATSVSLNPAWTFSTTDADSDDLFYRLEISTNSDFARTAYIFDQRKDATGWSQTNSYNSGDSALFTLPSKSSLNTGQTYYWRVRAIDAKGDYSAYSSVRSFTTVSPSTTVSFVETIFGNNINTDKTTATYKSLEKASLSATNTFSSATNTFGAGKTAAMLAFDADGDGDIDVLTKNVTGVNSQLYLNNGSASFSGGSTINDFAESTLWVNILHAADAENDGDLDVFDKDGYIYLNNGSGTLSSTDGPEAAAVGDLNNDGYVDILEVKGAGTASSIYVNDGSGNFTVLYPNPLSGITADDSKDGYIVDINGDQYLDIVVLTNSGASRLFINNGDLTFTLSSPFGSSAIFFGTFTDIDSDGDNDFIAKDDSALGVFFNTGSGTFTSINAITSSCQTTAYNITASDIDADTDPDLLVACGNGNSQNYLYRNNGDGTFSNEQAFAGTGGTSVILAEDLDGDGDKDLMVANGDGGENPLTVTQNYLYTTSASIVYDKTTLATDEEVRAAFDSDNDGYVDLYVTASSGQGELWVNDGDQSYTESNAFSTCAYVVETADVDNDGDLDVIDGCSSAADKLYINDGSNSFTDTGAVFTANSFTTTDIESGDMDNDGDIDFLFTYSGQIPSICLNDGVGTAYTCSDLGSTASISESGADLGDINNDGILDIVIALNSNNVTVYTGDGDGTFTSSSTVATETDYVNFADLDNDYDLDFLVGTSTLTMQLNDGSGSFNETVALPTCAGNNHSLVDIDSDHDFDILVACTSGGSEIWENIGDLSFVKQASLLADGAGAEYFVTNDFDSDGDIDIWSVMHNETSSYRFDLKQTYPTGTNYIYQTDEIIDAGINVFSAILTADDYAPTGSAIQYYLASVGPQYNFSGNATGTYSTLNGILHASDGYVFAVGDSGAIVTSDDYGATWQVKSAPVSSSFYDVLPTTELEGIIIGAGGKVYYTGDAFGTYSQKCMSGENPLTSSDLFDISAHSNISTYVYFSGAIGAVIKADISSLPTMTCSALTTGVSVDLNGIAEMNNNEATLVAVGDVDAGAGTIITTANSGSTWTTRTSGVAVNLNDVDAASDTSLAVAVGDSGKILLSVDNGANWATKTSGTSENINSVSINAEDPTAIWAGANNDTILYSSDSGNTWTVITTNSSSDWQSVSATDGQVIFSGTNGVITFYQSYDSVWEGPISNGTSWDFISIDRYIWVKAVLSTTDANEPPLIRGLNLSYSTNDPGTPARPDDNPPAPNAPASPSAETPSVLSSTSIQWNFTDNASNETGFKLYDSDNTAVKDQAETNILSITESALTPNTKYTRYITAYNNDSESSQVLLPEKYTFANIPTISSIAVTSSTSVNLELSNNANPVSTEYAFYEVTTGTWLSATNTLGTAKIYQPYTTWAPNGKIAVNSLTKGSTYIFKAIAKNGDSIESDLSAGYQIEVTQPLQANIVLSKKVGINIDQSEAMFKRVVFGQPVMAYGDKGRIMSALPFYSNLVNGYLLGGAIFLIIFILGIVFSASERQYVFKLKHIRHLPRFVFSDWKSKQAHDVYRQVSGKEVDPENQNFHKYHKYYKYRGLTMILLFLGVIAKMALISMILILVYTNIGTKAFVNESGEVVSPGDILTYHIDYTNNGQQSASGLVIRDSIPAGSSYLVGSINVNGLVQTDVAGDDLCSLNVAQVVCNINSLASQASGYIQFQVTVAGLDGDIIINSSQATYNQSQENKYSNSVSNEIVTNLLPQCNDGIDNDDDGQIDALADYGCDSIEDDTENTDIFINTGSTIDVTVSPTWQYFNYKITGKARFTHRNASHSVELVSANNANSTATVRVASDPFVVDLTQGASVTVDSDNNNIKDLNLMVLDVLSDSQAIIGLSTVTEVPPVYQCSDGIDNDGDSKIDLSDPGCANSTDNNEYNAPPENPDIPDQPQRPDEPTDLPDSPPTDTPGGGTSEDISNDSDQDLADLTEQINDIDNQIAESDSTTEKISLTLEKTTIQLEKTILEVSTAVSDTINIVNDKFLDNAKVEKVTSQVVAPTMITFTTVGVANVFTAAATASAGVSGGAGILSYIQFLFVQPILLFTRKKREKWGVVYDSITKKPISLAIIRVFDKQSGRIIQTRVSDNNGRYQVIVDPGEYYLEVSKDEYKFPSEILYGAVQDDKYFGLYHGEQISADDKLVLNYNIPVDPDKKAKVLSTEIRQKFLKKVQYLISFIGPAGALISLIIKPTIWVAVIFVVQVILLLIFKKMTIPAKLKNWGEVLDAVTGRKLKNAIVRIFDSKYNKLLESQVTDSKGRYGFLVSKNTYYLTSQKSDYQQYKSEEIPISDEQGGLITKRINLKKGSDHGHLDQPLNPLTTPSPQPETPPSPETNHSPDPNSNQDKFDYSYKI
ncbi:hypothetical protein A2223_00310 [Candidatus Falkowbacteria bacterium RIFOXYA2_FULL_35_8]|nr:MAG: hypothetical protein A2223_00310 [Candidatus Falkowbacteria bacterium RIFOXYA2_FULL_35_8]